MYFNKVKNRKVLGIVVEITTYKRMCRLEGDKRSRWVIHIEKFTFYVLPAHFPHASPEAANKTGNGIIITIILLRLRSEEKC